MPSRPGEAAGIAESARTSYRASGAGVVGSAFALVCCAGFAPALGLLSALGLGFLINDAVLIPLLVLALGLVASALTVSGQRVERPRRASLRGSGVAARTVGQSVRSRMMNEDREAAFDLVIVGGGSAGFAAAIKGAELGARVAMVEAGTLGGTCVDVGCVPSKTLIRAAEATVPGLTEAGFLDSAAAMALDRLPASLIVIGASAVGLELAQMFARLGVKVTVLETLPRVVPAEDPAVGEALAEYLRAEGVEVYPGVQVERVSRGGNAYTADFRAGGRLVAVRGEQLLVATGRRPNSQGLGLEAIGVTLGTKGEIIVDEFLQTTDREVYAASDVLGDPMFVYVAAYGGTVAAENALTGNSRRYDLSALPKVTFTDPAVASVELTEAEARSRGIEPLVADAVSRKIIGAHILATEAGEMVTEPALAIRFGLTIEDLTSTFHPYLTLSEGIKLAAQTFDRDVAKLSCCAT